MWLLAWLACAGEEGPAPAAAPPGVGGWALTHHPQGGLVVEESGTVYLDCCGNTRVDSVHTYSGGLRVEDDGTAYLSVRWIHDEQRTYLEGSGGQSSVRYDRFIFYTARGWDRDGQTLTIPLTWSERSSQSDWDWERVEALDCVLGEDDQSLLCAGHPLGRYGFERCAPQDSARCDGDADDLWGADDLCPTDAETDYGWAITDGCPGAPS